MCRRVYRCGGRVSQAPVAPRRGGGGGKTALVRQFSGGGAQCAPGATSGKLLFLGSFGTPDASARFGARQGTLGPAPVHFGRVQRSVGPGEDVLLGGSPAKKKRERKERKDADG